MEGISSRDFEVLCKKHNGLCLFFQASTLIVFVLSVIIIVYNYFIKLDMPMHGLAYLLLGIIVTSLVVVILQKLKFKRD